MNQPRHASPSQSPNRRARRLGRATLASMAAALALAFAMPAPAQAQGFKFSEAEKADQQREANEAAARQGRINALLATPCAAKLKNQKILMMIGLERGDIVDARQGNFTSQFNAVSSRLRTLGLRVLTQGELRAQIAQAEIDAFFKGNIEAAKTASSRMQAPFVLKGLIRTSTGVNPLVNVKQVQMNMDFVLTGANGALISQVTKSDTSFSGTDVQSTSMELINKHSDEAVAELYAEYCTKAK
jgi:hypothetical protein